MKPEQIEFLIKALTERSDASMAANKMPEWSRLDAAIAELIKWRDGGARGNCPVDYEKEGIALPIEVKPTPVGASVPLAELSETVVTKNPVASRPSTEASVLPAPASLVKKEQPEPAPATAGPEREQVLRKPVQATPPVPAPEGSLEDLAKWNKRLDEARTELEQDINAGIKSLEGIRSSENVPDVIHQEAETLVKRAASKREQQITTLLAKAQQAQKDENWDLAEKSYQSILALDPDDRNAPAGLVELKNARAEAERRLLIQELKINLLQFQDAEALEKAVRKAEQLRAQKQADDELIQLLKEARPHFDEMRERQGKTTTKSHSEQLEKRAEAVCELEYSIVKLGEKIVFDAEYGKYIPASDALATARENLTKKSAEVTKSELDVVQGFIPQSLDDAKERLLKNISSEVHVQNVIDPENPHYIFQENDRAILQGRLADVEADIVKRDAALELIEKARTAVPQAGLDLLLEAQRKWSHLEGLDKQIEGQQELVAGILANQMHAKLREARNAIHQESYPDAGRLAQQAIVIAEKYRGKKPTVLSAAISEAAQLSNEIEQAVKIAADFSSFESEIRRLVSQPDMQEAAYDLFQKRKAEFQGYPRVVSLETEVNVYRDANAEWKKVQMLAGAVNPDWQEILHRCDLLKVVKSGDIAQRAVQLRENAMIELQIQEAQRLLKNSDFEKADAMLKETIRLHKDRQGELEPLLEELKGYRQNDARVRPRWNRAQTLKESKGYEQCLEALRIFQEISEEAEKSSYTDKAADEADKLGGSLHDTLLPKLQEAAEKRKTDSLNDEDLEQLATWARVLRAGGLAIGDEKMLVRTAEVAFYRRQAEKQAETGQWKLVAEMWEKLQAIWPDVVDIQAEARKARKQQAIKEAMVLFTREEPQKALELLRQEQTRDNWGGDAELNYFLGEAYLGLANFDDAKRCAQVVAKAGSPDLAQKGEELLQQINTNRSIRGVLAEASPMYEKRQYESVLDRLGSLPEDLQSHPDVTKFREKMVREAQEELLRSAKDERERGTPDGLVNAVEFLIRLRGIETRGVSREIKSQAELETLKDQLPMSARQVIRTTANFQPNQLSLDAAIAEARRLANQLQAFLSIPGDFPADTWPDLQRNIQQQVNRLGESIGKLEKIKGLLAEIVAGDAGSIWLRALRTGKFDTVQAKTNSILTEAGQDLQVLDARDFILQLTETIEVRKYIGNQYKRLKEGRDNLFLAKEDYPDAIATCNALRNLPARKDVSSSAKTDWQGMTQTDYAQILEIADPELDFYDSFSDQHLSGLVDQTRKPLLLSALQKWATVRRDDAKKWEDWIDQGETLYGFTKKAYEDARRASGGALEVKRYWEQLVRQADAALTHLSKDPAPVSSNRAETIKNSSLEYSADISRWKAEAENRMEAYAEYATDTPLKADDILRLIKNGSYAELGESLIRAKFNRGDKTFNDFVEHTEKIILRNLKDIPSIDRLERLVNEAEKCLGADDSLSNQFREKLAQLTQQPNKKWWRLGQKKILD